MARIVTHAMATSRLEGRGIELLFYPGQVSRQSKFRCLKDGCGHEWTATLNSVCSVSKPGEGSGCPRCAGIIELGVDEAVRRLAGRPIELLRYSGNTTEHSTFQCLVPNCGRIWDTSYSNVDFNRRGCPSCAGREAISEQEILRRLQGRGITLLSYAGTGMGSSTFKCMKDGCGHEWSATANDVTNGGKGCPACADYGFNPTKPASFYLYLITDGTAEYLGFGITRRLKGRGKYHANTFDRAGVLGEMLCSYDMDGADAQRYEKSVKDTFQIVDTGVAGFRREAVIFSEETLARIKLGAEQLASVAI